MADKFSFGIGCFHFGVKKGHPFKFEGREYIEELKKNLEYISNIDNIKILHDDDLKNYSTHITQELPNIENGKGLFPKPLFVKIEFQVYIPFRIQAQILEKKKVPTSTEKFRVSINYTYHLPVTFIELINPSEEGDPSSAVVIVREFLEHEFKNIKFNYIQFECLGPSPFRTDCYICPKKSDGKNEVDWDIQSKIIPQRGYDRIIFYYNPKKFTTAEEAKKVIFDEIQDELGFFYRIVQLEVEKMHHWEQIQHLIDQLTSIHLTKGIKYFLKKVFIRSKLINETLISLIEFESKELFFHNISQRNYRDIYNYREEKCFQPYIDKQLKERFAYPTNEMSQLISFFENRRIKAVEVFIILVAAIVGGGIGALLTILLSK